MFFDEKTAGIELIHHGVRTATGGAIRLTDESQWTFPASVPDADCPMARLTIATLRPTLGISAPRSEART